MEIRDFLWLQENTGFQDSFGFPGGRIHFHGLIALLGHRIRNVDPITCASRGDVRFSDKLEAMYETRKPTVQRIRGILMRLRYPLWLYPYK